MTKRPHPHLQDHSHNQATSKLGKFDVQRNFPKTYLSYGRALEAEFPLFPSGRNDTPPVHTLVGWDWTAWPQNTLPKCGADRMMRMAESDKVMCKTDFLYLMTFIAPLFSVWHKETAHLSQRWQLQQRQQNFDTLVTELCFTIVYPWKTSHVRLIIRVIFLILWFFLGFLSQAHPKQGYCSKTKKNYNYSLKLAEINYKL